MSDELKLDTAHTAVLCMDYQKAIVSAYGGDQIDEMLGRAGDVLAAARMAGMPVIYIHVGFRPGLPEIDPRNVLFGAIKNDHERMKMFTGDGQTIHPAVAPKENDISITKHRVGGFTGTDLDMILRSNEIDSLVLFGIATSGVVLSTLVEAFDADYQVVVVRDCCADRDEELHNALIDKYFPSRGKVITSNEFCNALKEPQVVK